jgi:hypothetical protein
MKVWVFKETGEFRPPKKGDYYLNINESGIDGCYRAYFNHETSFPILTLQVFDHDPMAPIREVY